MWNQVQLYWRPGVANGAAPVTPSIAKLGTGQAAETVAAGGTQPDNVQRGGQGLGLPPEWLVTNGIGGFASGTMPGHHTRRYHGWLVAALRPPVQRMLLWTKSEEELIVSDGRWPLSANDYGDMFHPDGWRRVHSCRVYPFPTTVFSAGGAMLERTIFMVHGQNTTAVIYRLLAGPPGLELRVEPLINCRDYHHTVRANDWPFHQQTWEHGVEIRAYAEAPPLILAGGTVGSGTVGSGTVGSGTVGSGTVGSGTAQYEPNGAWFYHFHYEIERERGLDCVEDHFRPGAFRWALDGPGDVAVLVGHCPVPGARHEPPWRDGPRALTKWVLDQYDRAVARREHVVKQALDARRARLAGPSAAGLRPAPERASERPPAHSAAHSQERSVAADSDWLRLVLAADDFIAHRATTGAATLIAGYPWFTDWGRDAMISLPGLLLHTGRSDTAREVLLTFAEHRADGLIPNRFPDDGGEPHYNTVDASLWWVYAALYYWRLTGDESTVRGELFPVMVDIVRSYVRGTRHGIGIDEDGLVRAADPGLQLTWMDAKVGDWVVTPRHGAPVEINALWYNALRSVENLAATWAPNEVGDWTRLADSVGRAFRRRFMRLDGSLYDVAAPRGVGASAPDASMRSNQVFAASLPFSALTGDEARHVVRHVTRELLTPVGLRTLSPSDRAYHGVYRGDQWARDAAYHQGTVWPWLLGPYASAVRRKATLLRAPGPPTTAATRPPEGASDAWMDGLRAHLRHEAALGHVSEIFDGDAPHAPRGCFAQAWSVAEWLRVWS